ncbi:MAG: phage holin family protein [Clostridia bacterium]|nr:phage holin family protein [Clostridia bacterium]
MSWDKLVKLAGAAAGLFGQWDAALTVLAAMMAADYLSGVAVAACGRSPKTEAGGLSSKAGFIGLAKKGFELLIVLLAALLDRAAGGEAMMFRTAATCYYIANEGLSVIENAALMGVPVPKKLRGALEAMKERDAGEEKTAGIHQDD